MKTTFLLLTVIFVCDCHQVSGDIGGPSYAMEAATSDLKTIVRIKKDNSEYTDPETLQQKASVFSYDEKKDVYTKTRTFVIRDTLGQFMYVTKNNSLLIVSISGGIPIRHYSFEGKLLGSWDWSDFLTQKEQMGVRETGSTFQWFDKGMVIGKAFMFSGPSRSAQMLSPPYSVIRNPNPPIPYKFIINLKDGKLQRIPN